MNRLAARPAPLFVPPPNSSLHPACRLLSRAAVDKTSERFSTLPRGCNDLAPRTPSPQLETVLGHHDSVLSLPFLARKQHIRGPFLAWQCCPRAGREFGGNLLEERRRSLSTEKGSSLGLASTARDCARPIAGAVSQAPRASLHQDFVAVSEDMNERWTRFPVDSRLFLSVRCVWPSVGAMPFMEPPEWHHRLLCLRSPQSACSPGNEAPNCAAVATPRA